MVRAQSWYVLMSITPSLFIFALMATALSRVPPLTDVITLSTNAFPWVSPVWCDIWNDVMLSKGCRIHKSDWQGRNQTLNLCHHIITLVVFGVCLSILDRRGSKFHVDAGFEAFLNLPLCQICRNYVREKASLWDAWSAAGLRFKRGRVLLFDLMKSWLRT